MPVEAAAASPPPSPRPSPGPPAPGALFEAIGRRPWNSRRYALPDWHRRYPTMLTREEMRMLAWLAQNLSIPGDIADLGCFLGGSSVSLAWGVAQSGRRAGSGATTASRSTRGSSSSSSTSAATASTPTATPCPCSTG